MQKKMQSGIEPVLILWQSFHTVMYQYKATYYKEYFLKPTIDRTDGIDFELNTIVNLGYWQFR